MSTRKFFPRFRRGRLQALAGLAVVIALGGSLPAAAQGNPPQPANAKALAPVGADVTAPNPLAGVRSWAYQLQHSDSSEIARSPYDLVVIDHTKDGDPKRMLRPAELARMKKKPDGSRRIVLAYVSIGEAEDYRFYWNDNWIETATPDVPDAAAPPTDPAAVAAGQSTVPPLGAATGSKTGTDGKAGVQPLAAAVDPNAKVDRWVSPTAPAWLGDESESWSGNFAVKYWDKGWQDLIIGNPGAFVERVLALGFDGVYLDRVDAYYEHIDEHPSAAEDMIDFVIRLAEAARKAKPGAIVVPQNGEELLTRPAYVAAIDAIAKEDLLYGSPTEGQSNSQAQINNSLGWLENATKAGRPVLVVEYLDAQPVIEQAVTELTSRGFVSYFGPRALDKLARPWAIEAAAGAARAARTTAGATGANAQVPPASAKASSDKSASVPAGKKKKARRKR